MPPAHVQAVFDDFFQPAGVQVFDPYPLAGTTTEKRNYIVKYYTAYIANASTNLGELWSDAEDVTPLSTYFGVSINGLSLQCSRTHCLNIAAVLGATLGFRCAALLLLSRLLAA